MRRARVGVQGEFLRQFEFEVERELRETDTPWRDVFLNWQPIREFQIRGGKFKMPFGMEQLTPPMDLNFVYRAMISNQLVPARETGTMVHGRFFGRGLQYAAGWFRADGENSRNDNVATGQRTLAARVIGRPLRLLNRRGLLRTAEFGMAATDCPLPDGLNALRGRTSFRETFFPRYFVRGRRLRLGTEFNWQPGPFGLFAELMHVRDNRFGQSLRATDLPDLIYRGWYVAGTWLVTGERKYEGVEPRKAFLTGRGMGAIEIAVRAEAVRLGSAQHIGTPSRSSRASNILGSSDRAWTFGLNWYVNHWTKIQGNAIRDTIEDVQRSPLPGHTLFWSRIVRIQVSI
jgi:phosphate-selective porin OprO/OprP